MRDDLAQPAGEVGRRRSEAAHAAQVEMGMRVDQAGQNGGIAEIDIITDRKKLRRLM